MTKENLQASILDLNSRLESERMAPFFKIIFFYLRELYVHLSTEEGVVESEAETRYIEIRRR
ncbi:hypothetical protein [uncultured Cloacibacillus sp.]|jgi:hypothetical protein|uniref:hypothetical protein n=1 Tax=uncultured Cloacibacillus sp. TaxID=889794 RepID=UPI0027D9668C|nr:hypothetical protein [uncultured Cloacibacillus sp.]